MIDLYVKKGGRVIEVYEVKTGVGRQELYTAIGQLVTHAATSTASKFLVVPANEEIAEDLASALRSLAITVRRFELIGTPSKRKIRLLD